jgi:hypothetical protein
LHQSKHYGKKPLNLCPIQHQNEKNKDLTLEKKKEKKKQIYYQYYLTPELYNGLSKNWIGELTKSLKFKERLNEQLSFQKLMQSISQEYLQFGNVHLPLIIVYSSPLLNILNKFDFLGLIRRKTYNYFYLKTMERFKINGYDREDIFHAVQSILTHLYDIDGYVSEKTHIKLPIRKFIFQNNHNIQIVKSKCYTDYYFLPNKIIAFSYNFKALAVKFHAFETEIEPSDCPLYLEIYELTEIMKYFNVDFIGLSFYKINGEIKIRKVMENSENTGEENSSENENMIQNMTQFTSISLPKMPSQEQKFELYKIITQPRWINLIEKIIAYQEYNYSFYKSKFNFFQKGYNGEQIIKRNHNVDSIHLKTNFMDAFKCEGNFTGNAHIMAG